MLYVGSAAVFAYAGFRRGEASVVRLVVAAMGTLLLVTELLLAPAGGSIPGPAQKGG